MRGFRIPEMFIGFLLGAIFFLFSVGMTSYPTIMQFLAIDHTSFLTLFLVVSNIGLWIAANKQIILTRDDFNATHRPWVSVAVAIGPKGLYFDSSGANLHLTFRCKNTGKTPAVNVWVETQTFLESQDRRPLEEQRRACDHVRTRRDHPSAPGTTIFPGDTAHFNYVYSFIGRDDLEQEASQHYGFISPVIVGCVDYRFTFGEPAHHQTGFIYYLHKIAPNGAHLAIRPADGDVPGTSLHLEQTFVASSGFFAD